MRTSEQINDLAAALAKAQAKIEGAVKDKENPGFRGSKYADLGAVWEAIREPLTTNGLSVTQWLRSVEGGIEVETLLLHSTGQFMSDVFAVPVGKQDAQGYGSAATYARRYALMAAVGIAPVDDDGDAAKGKGDGKEFNPQAPRQGASPPQNGNGKAPVPTAATTTAISADTRQQAAEVYVSQSIEAFGKMATQTLMTAWWTKNAAHVDKLEAKFPELYERLLSAFDERRDSFRNVTEAA